MMITLRVNLCFFRYLQKQEYARPSQLLNTRQRKSFRSRLKDSRWKSNNDIFNQHYESKRLNDITKVAMNDQGASVANQNIHDKNTNGDPKKKRPNIILMMSDDQVKFIGYI